ncbi:MAG: ComF family protein [Clostridia bacterium]|nr:ComF family protein [Clostridia bacterium]
MNFHKFIDTYIFPWDTGCISCDDHIIENHRYGLCSDCIKALPRLKGQRCKFCLDEIDTEGLCARCLKNPPEYDQLFIPLTYSGFVQGLVQKFKYEGAQYLRYPLANMVFDAINPKILPVTDYIIPVPASKARMEKYLYNQTELLARELSDLSGVPVKCDVLFRKDTSSKTVSLSREERQKLIKEQYYFSSFVKGKTVLLVDDVVTTGETLRVCSSLLKKAGASRIYCCAIARTDLN